MTRHNIVDLLDGTHERWGNNVALALHSLIMLSAIAIALETLKGLPPMLTRLLYDFEVFILLVFVD